MYDPDAGHSPALRLAPIREAKTPDAELAEAYREMTEATMRWIDARMKVEAIKAQSRPIPASEAVLSADSDFWAHRHRVMGGLHPKIARSSGHIDRLTAAASVEIRDPADALRTQETLT